MPSLSFSKCLKEGKKKKIEKPLPPAGVAVNLLCFMLCMCTEFEEATDLLSVDPGASTISISTPGSAAATASSDVRLNLSDDEENQQESSGVRLPPQFTRH